MATAGLKLNPAIAKELSSGQIQCLICVMPVRAKIWLSHVNSKKHREAAENLKKQLKSGRGPPPPAKRPPPARGASPPSKKAREPTPPSESDEDEEEETEPSVSEPWQKAAVEDAAAKASVRVLPQPKGGLIEGVPQGFFDDKRKNERVLEAVEKNADMEAEYERFMKEMGEKEAQEKEEMEQEVEKDNLQRELAYIDEQMERLKKLNEMEKRREAVVEKAKDAPKKMEEEDEDDGDLDELDIDNWRAKGV